MFYYQFNIGDYAAATKGLSLLEDLAYRRILDLYYTSEQPLNECLTDVAREIGMRDQQQEVDYVVQKYFTLTADGWSQKRAEREVEAYQSKQKSASKAGKASAEARRIKASEQTFNDRSTTVQPNIKHKTLNIKQEPVTNTTGSPAIADKPPSDTDQQFVMIWKAYPKREGSNPKNKALSGYRARIKEGISPDLMAAGVERYYRYCLAKGTILTEYVMQAQRFFGKEKAFENDWIITENENAAHQQRFTKQSKSDRDDEAMRKYLAENSDAGGNDEDLEDFAGMEAGSLRSGQH